jgi:hypothetical protein
MIAVVFIVSKSFSPPHIMPNNSFAANLSASGNAGVIITGADILDDEQKSGKSESS